MEGFGSFAVIGDSLPCPTPKLQELPHERPSMADATYISEPIPLKLREIERAFALIEFLLQNSHGK
jgi:hypothetical protein